MTILEAFAYLRAEPAAEAIDFYARAFGAVEAFRLTAPDGRIGHVELRFGPATIMLSDPFPEFGIAAPDPDGGGASIHLHVEDADAAIAQAVAAGARLIRPAADQFYGERAGAVRDPFGHDWIVGHAIERIDPAEMQRRYDALGRRETGDG
jgi:PhnB protein